MTTITKPPTALLPSRTPDATPVPLDAREEVRSTRYGPCEVDKGAHYAVVPTNQLGELQLHVCRPCARAFVYSETYGFLEVRRGTPLMERIDTAIDDAKAAKAPGWAGVIKAT